MKFRKIAIIAWKHQSSELALALQKISEWALLHPEIEFIASESLKKLCPPPIQVVSTENLSKVHLIIAIGGDGTMLSTARFALQNSTPILGVNVGRVGFLAETQVEDLQDTLDLLILGKFSTSTRLMLDIQVYSGEKKVFSEVVLNELHIRSSKPGKMVNLEVDYNKKHLTEYWADSLLISTPTGSTAYNLSANGPIIYPSTLAFVLTPLAPSSLSVRPLILPATAECEIRFASKGVGLSLVFDGNSSYELKPGERIVISKSQSVTTFIRVKSSAFVDALREKLGWTGKPKLKTKPFSK